MNAKPWLNVLASFSTLMINIWQHWCRAHKDQGMVVIIAVGYWYSTWRRLIAQTKQRVMEVSAWKSPFYLCRH